SSGQILYGTSASGVASAATTSVSCSTGINCTGFTVIGGSPITISGFTFPWTSSSNFNTNFNSTSTPIWFKGGPVSLAASSTSWFDQINVGSSTSGTLATSTFFGNLAINGTA